MATSIPVAGTVLPEQRELLLSLAHSQVFFAATVLVIGILILLFGWKAHRWVVALNCAAFGLYVGAQLGQKVQIATVGAILGALLLGVVCWPLMKYAVAMSGGLVGAIVGMALWTYCQQPADLRWAGGLIGMVVLGLLCFILFKASVIVFCSIQGAIMLVMGVAALLMKYTPWHGQVFHSLNQRPVLMPLLVFSVALMGLIYQQRQHGLTDRSTAAKDE